MIETRWSSPGDAAALAAVHAASWRFAYGGLIPGLALERMVAARGREWWRDFHDRGERALVVTLDDRLLGYAMLGRSRARRFPPSGEIYELYLDPVCHGAGLGKRLFLEARRRLEARSLRGLLIWSLAVNEAGCRFYRDMGGEAKARAHTRLARTKFELIAFAWP